MYYLLLYYSIDCTVNSTVPASNSFSAPPQGAVVLTNRNQQQVYFYCPLPAGAALGTQFSGYLWLSYNTMAQNNIMVQFATVNAKVSGYNAPSVTVATTTLATTTTSASTTTSHTTSTSVKTSLSTSTIPASTSTTTVYYVYFTLQNVAKHRNARAFQQMISFNSIMFNAYEATNLGNIRFYYSNAPAASANELYSWCESGCTSSSSNAIFWVKLTSAIGANSNAIVNATFLTTQTNYDDNYAGEAPQISSTYAQYDNANSVFPWYQRWGGLSSMPSGWAGSLTSNTFNPTNAVLLTTMSGATDYISAPAGLTSFPFVYDIYGYLNGASAPVAIGMGSSTAYSGCTGSLNNWVISNLASGPPVHLGLACSYVAPYTSATLEVFTVLFSSATAGNVLQNYGSATASTATSNTPNYFEVGSVGGASVLLYWTRSRVYPPNGIMPGITVSGINGASTSTTSTSTTSTTSTSTTTTHYLYVTLQNSQGSATNTIFQQMVYFNAISYNSYESAGLGNVRFYNSNALPATANELDSWCESGCNTTASNAIFWVKLTSAIGATSNALLNMTFQPSSSANYAYDGVYAGEAPQLSTTYAQYDIGNTIFPWYQAWGGLSSPPGGWSGTIVASYGAQDAAFGSGGSSKTVYASPPSGLTTFPLVYDYYGDFASGTPTVGLATSDGTNGACSASLYNWAISLSGTKIELSCDSVGSYTYTGGTKLVFTALFSSATSGTLLQNYTSSLAVTATTGTPTYFIINTPPGGGYPVVVYWTRSRAYPPSGVMPTETLGSAH